MRTCHLHDLKEVRVVLVELEVHRDGIELLDEVLAADLAQPLGLRHRLAALAFLLGHLSLCGFCLCQVKQPDRRDEGVFRLLVALEEVRVPLRVVAEACILVEEVVVPRARVDEHCGIT